jgi:hypothetical protein
MEKNQTAMKNHLKRLAMREITDSEIVKNTTTGTTDIERQPSPPIQHRFVECPRNEDCVYSERENL